MANIISDMQSEQLFNYQSLQWVGMGQIETALLKDKMQIPTRLDFYVNLKKGYRGIHMSRLYNLMIENFLNKKVSITSVQNILKKAIQSQETLSNKSYLTLNYELPVKTKALKSLKPGYRNYPVKMNCQYDETENKFLVDIEFHILYSSTCPQSAALSVEEFNSSKTKPLLRLPATPHAQRSLMKCKMIYSENKYPLDLKKDFNHFIISQIKKIESVLGTPVQTAVKKIDELTFAKLNSENLMFCEDAVRKVDLYFQTLQKKQNLTHYHIYTQHEESLHPHNAVAMITR